MTPRCEQLAVAARRKRGLAAITHAAGDRVRCRWAAERGHVQLRLLRHGDAIRFPTATVFVVCRANGGVLGHLAMIEPHDVDLAACVNGDRLPAAVARRVAAWNDGGRRVGLPAIHRSRALQYGAARPLRGPDNGDRIALHSNAWRLLS